MITWTEIKDFFKWLTYYLKLTWCTFKESSNKRYYVLLTILSIVSFILIPRILIISLVILILISFYNVDKD